MIAVGVGVQKISGIQVSDSQTKEILDTLPDCEVTADLFLILASNCRFTHLRFTADIREILLTSTQCKIEGRTRMSAI